ncbi:hypothetical protein IWQ60_007353 [Tieghemiomyces parasiticus]|uniref:RxLR effector candidate protein n=1 Tax=Tieghemiomyces parasiticus TaxID=78921 RepID=A0A9W8A1N4_9FUNG|nr:hypothetical protein IWQ60_007353 [Tieghemiomyces parasiticus]
MTRLRSVTIFVILVQAASSLCGTRAAPTDTNHGKRSPVTRVDEEDQYPRMGKPVESTYSSHSQLVASLHALLPKLEPSSSDTTINAALLPAKTSPPPLPQQSPPQTADQSPLFAEFSRLLADVDPIAVRKQAVANLDKALTAIPLNIFDADGDHAEASITEAVLNEVTAWDRQLNEFSGQFIEDLNGFFALTNAVDPLPFNTFTQAAKMGKDRKDKEALRKAMMVTRTGNYAKILYIHQHDIHQMVDRVKTYDTLVQEFRLFLHDDVVRLVERRFNIRIDRSLLIAPDDASFAAIVEQRRFDPMMVRGESTRHGAGLAAGEGANLYNTFLRSTTAESMQWYTDSWRRGVRLNSITNHVYLQIKPLLNKQPIRKVSPVFDVYYSIVFRPFKRATEPCPTGRPAKQLRREPHVGDRVE